MEKYLLQLLAISLSLAVGGQSPNVRYEIAESNGDQCLYDKQNWPRKTKVKIQGDVMLGVIVRVHEKSDAFTCGPVVTHGGVEVVEAILHTLDLTNNDANFLKGYKLGVIIQDDCDSDTIGVDKAVGFIKGGSSIEGNSCHGSNTTGGNEIIGVIGGTSSATSIQIASLLKLFKKPQISHSSTSPELSNRERYPYFLRTLPSDTVRAEAIVNLFKQLNWTYVSTVIDNNFYGSQSVNELDRLLREANICTAVTAELKGNSPPEHYENIVKKLREDPNAKGVIVFGYHKDIGKLMKAVDKTNSTGNFVWISGTTWTGKPFEEDAVKEQLEGAIVVQPFAAPFQSFTKKFNQLRPASNKRNPWFAEYWEETFDCRYESADRQTRTPHNCHYKKNCTGNEVPRMSDQLQKQEPLILQAHTAVMAYSKMLQKMHVDICGQNFEGMCGEMKTAIHNGTKVLEYLQNNKFIDLRDRSEGLVKSYFEKSGGGPERYEIANFQRDGDGRFQWVKVGKYQNKKLTITWSKLKFRQESMKHPQSICSKPCGKGQARQSVGNKCCWNCVNCTAFQILSSTLDKCIECPNGTHPSRSGDKCQPIPFDYLRYTDGVVIGALIFAIIGVLATVFVIAVFIRYRETAVVRASGRELSFVLLAGILLCYLITFVLTAKPSGVTCGFQKAGIGLCYTVCYAALLTKTVRIARIFNSAKQTAKRPKFISPSSQLLICGALVMVELLVDALWLMEIPPKAGPFYPTRMEHHLVCESLKGMEYMIGFAYPMLLIIICTVYAIITRKIPEGFNESKYIGFTMYTTCIIWLAFVPIYVTTAKNIQLRVITMCFSVSLSATVSLLCLFAPKLYIILLRPERNVRSSLMNSTRKSTVPPATSVFKYESSFTEEITEMKNHVPKPVKSSCSLSSDAGINISSSTQTEAPTNFVEKSVQTTDCMSRLRDKYPHLTNRMNNH